MMVHMDSHPETIFFSITTECPLRCRICSLWKSRNPQNALSRDQRLEVVDQLKGFCGPVHVEITGGEPFTKLNELLSMAKRLHEQGNSMGVVTNGLLLTPSVLRKLEGAGVDHIAISLDFPTAEQHDAQRGIRGTYKRAIKAIEWLVEAKRKGKAVPSIGINAVIMDQNINYLEDVAMMAAGLGVKEILFQPIQPDFGSEDSVSMDEFLNWLPILPSRVDKLLVKLDSLRQVVPITQSNLDFKVFCEYFRNPTHLRPGTCLGPQLNLVIDVNGNVTHCFGQRRTGIGPLGRVPKDNIVDLWNCKTAQGNRALLRNCTFGCGVLICHNRSSERGHGAIRIPVEA